MRGICFLATSILEIRILRSLVSWRRYGDIYNYVSTLRIFPLVCYSGSVVNYEILHWCRHIFIIWWKLKRLGAAANGKRTRVSSLVVELNLLRTVFRVDLLSRKIRVNILRWQTLSCWLHVRLTNAQLVD